MTVQQHFVCFSNLFFLPSKHIKHFLASWIVSAKFELVRIDILWRGLSKWVFHTCEVTKFRPNSCKTSLLLLENFPRFCLAMVRWPWLEYYFCLYCSSTIYSLFYSLNHLLCWWMMRLFQSCQWFIHDLRLAVSFARVKQRKQCHFLPSRSYLLDYTCRTMALSVYVHCVLLLSVHRLCLLCKNFCLVEVKRMFSAVATARHRILPKVHLFVDKNFASCSEKRNFVFWLSPMV